MLNILFHSDTQRCSRVPKRFRSELSISLLNASSSERERLLTKQQQRRAVMTASRIATAAAEPALAVEDVIHAAEQHDQILVGIRRSAETIVNSISVDTDRSSSDSDGEGEGRRQAQVATICFSSTETVSTSNCQMAK